MNNNLVLLWNKWYNIYLVDFPPFLLTVLILNISSDSSWILGFVKKQLINILLVEDNSLNLSFAVANFFKMTFSVLILKLMFYSPQRLMIVSIILWRSDSCNVLLNEHEQQRLWSWENNENLLSDEAADNTPMSIWVHCGNVKIIFSIIGVMTLAKIDNWRVFLTFYGIMFCFILAILIMVIWECFDSLQFSFSFS